MTWSTLQLRIVQMIQDQDDEDFAWSIDSYKRQLEDARQEGIVKNDGFWIYLGFIAEENRRRNSLTDEQREEEERARVLKARKIREEIKAEAAHKKQREEEERERVLKARKEREEKEARKRHKENRDREFKERRKREQEERERQQRLDAHFRELAEQNKRQNGLRTVINSIHRLDNHEFLRIVFEVERQWLNNQRNNIPLDSLDRELISTIQGEIKRRNNQQAMNLLAAGIFGYWIAS